MSDALSSYLISLLGPSNDTICSHFIVIVLGVIWLTSTLGTRGVFGKAARHTRRLQGGCHAKVKLLKTSIRNKNKKDAADPKNTAPRETERQGTF